MMDALLISLWRASWQAAVGIAALWCVCRVFEARRWLSADLRCWLWRGAYVKLLLGLFMVTSVALPVLPPLSRPREIAPVAGLPEVMGVREPFTVVPASVVPAARPAASGTVYGEKESVPLATWQTTLASLYLLGVGVCVSRVGHKGLATCRVLKEAVAQTADANDAEITGEIARLTPLFGLRRAPRLLRSPNVSIPAYAARTVLLPADTNYTAQETRLVLAHELAHAKRRDLAWEWLGTLAQIAFFFHPLVWLARREERLCREAAADALALRVTQARPADYGTLLLRFSLARVAQPLAGVIGIVDRGTLFRRRLLCLGEELTMDKQFGSRKRLLISIALLACISIVVFVPWSLQARAQKAASPQETTAQSESKRILSALRMLTAKEEYAHKQALRRKYGRAELNARQIGNACMMLLSDYDGVYKTTPSTFRKDVGPYLANNRMDKNAFTSPLDKPGTQSFVFNPTLKNVAQKKLKSPQNTVMAYEGEWGKPKFRYDAVALIVFADGHAKFIWPAQAKGLIWNPLTPLNTVRKAAQSQGAGAQTPPQDNVMATFKAQQAREFQAIAALEAGNTKQAALIGQQMLRNNNDTEGWNYGNIVHNANQILGLAALHEGRINDAKAFLLAAGATPGSPHLDYVGPHMVLAQKLLEKGEKQTVTDYLDLVARFWLHFPPDKLAQFKKNNLVNEKQITEWKEQIAAGETPKLHESDRLY